MNNDKRQAANRRKNSANARNRRKETKAIIATTQKTSIGGREISEKINLTKAHNQVAEFGNTAPATDTYYGQKKLTVTESKERGFILLEATR